jgi:AcrR family transcriptional regulator
MKREDPRVIRTRKLLEDAFVGLLAEKSFHAISVQDIAERATVNRATFYAHFEDKYVLLDHVIRSWFRDALAAQGLTEAPLGNESFRLLIETVLDFLGHFHGRCRPADRDMEPTLEATMQQELSTFLQGWLQEVPGCNAAPALSVETTANVVSWAIFGAGLDWSRQPQPDSLSERAARVLHLLTNGLSPLGVLSNESHTAVAAHTPVPV